MIKQVIWSSTIDWPNQLSSVLFFDKCNFNCYYCHNKDLSKQKEIPFNEILERLVERKSIVDHIILSGGECTLSDNFESIVTQLHNNGFKVGIHTNGSMISILEKLISQNKITFVGFDIKTYGDTDYKAFYDNYEETFPYEKVLYSLSRIKKYRDCELEVRTTLHSVILEDDLILIAKDLLRLTVDKWTLQYEVQNGKQIHYFTKEQYNEIFIKLNKILKVEFR